MIENWRVKIATSDWETLFRSQKDCRSFFSLMEVGMICSRLSVAARAWELAENLSPEMFSLVWVFRPRKTNTGIATSKVYPA
jgi:hypothetical protein